MALHQIWSDLICVTSVKFYSPLPTPDLSMDSRLKPDDRTLKRLVDSVLHSFIVNSCFGKCPHYLPLIANAKCEAFIVSSPVPSTSVCKRSEAYFAHVLVGVTLAKH